MAEAGRNHFLPAQRQPFAPVGLDEIRPWSVAFREGMAWE